MGAAIAIGIADLGTALAAAILSLLVAGIGPVGRWLAGVFGAVPLIGGWVGSHIAGTVRSVAVSMGRALESTMAPLGVLVKAPVLVTEDAIERLRALADSTIARVAGIVTVDIPAVQHWAAWWIDRDLHEAQDYAARVADMARQAATGLAVGLAATLTGHINGVITWADAAISTVWNRISDVQAEAHTWVVEATTDLQSWAAYYLDRLGADIDSVRADAAAQLADTAAALQAGIATAQVAAEADAERWASTVLAQGIGVLDTDAPAMARDVWADVTDAVGAAEAAAGAAMPRLGGMLGAIPRVGPATIGAALGALARAVAAGAEADARCTIPNCRNLSGFGRDLQGLGGILADGAFLAWLAAGAVDPAGWADDTRAVLAPIGDGAITGARDLLGVL